MNTYYDYALQDYRVAEIFYTKGELNNAICSKASEATEKMLKHIVELHYPDNATKASLLTTHSLTKLFNEITKEIPGVMLDRADISALGSFYFETRYPSDDSYMVTQQDVDVAWTSLNNIRRAVDSFLGY